MTPKAWTTKGEKSEQINCIIKIKTFHASKDIIEELKGSHRMEKIFADLYLIRD